MPALFSFLGGVASGHNAIKAAEADLAAKEKLAADKASARMDLAAVDNTAAQNRAFIKATVDKFGDLIAEASQIGDLEAVQKLQNNLDTFLIQNNLPNITFFEKGNAGDSSTGDTGSAGKVVAGETPTEQVTGTQPVTKRQVVVVR